ncbi:MULTISPECIES: ABC transporter permease [Enterococcus]|jgi:putative ABC transport system permease protein|uniref:ABC transporter permease n=1 Tax=Enterococcus TaxID=1350 RepID=UPI00189E871E|nr:ABC transporter permease [Enterococcus dispar]MCU7358475.1 ABC transporter permease [Enterococcus dispar]MDT2706636.1 ABC transporter permease [Enterococcus dispar]WCG33142.1 ABC transporter permease [Enterococcus dispar]
MGISESFKMALDSILANKMRSFLTMLGIIIGISAVIAILAVGNGATKEINGTFSDLGASTISVSTSQDASDSQKITSQDVLALKRSIPNIDHISPVTNIQGNLTANDKSKFGIALAGMPDLQYTNQMMDKDLLYGRYFNQTEYEENAKVTIISADTARYFFNGRENVVGEKITVKNQNGQVTLRILGVTKGTMENMMGSFDTDKMPGYLAIPLTTAVTLQPDATKMSELTVIAKSKDDIDTVSKQIVNILSVRHDTVGDKVYTATNFLQALDEVNNVLGLFINFIAAVAAIALLVGGIGVMNIMLVSVTERTREIGTRKALGATNNNILFQFLTESVILCLIGGLIGLLLGASLALIVANALNITAHFTLGSIAFVLLFSSAIGIFFGVYPARKAARLDPIEALRYE